MIREDCYWHSEEPDMGSRLHMCGMQKGIAPLESCDGCESYHSIRKRTNADRIRSMTDEEIEVWYWTMHEQMMWYTDSHLFLHEWLKQETTE